MKFRKALLLFIFSAVAFTVLPQTVHYTRTGQKYHTAGCRYLNKSDYSCSLKEAFAMGLSACSRCSPPTKITQTQVKPAPKTQKQPQKVPMK